VGQGIAAFCVIGGVNSEALYVGSLCLARIHCLGGKVRNEGRETKKRKR